MLTSLICDANGVNLQPEKREALIMPRYKKHDL